MTRRTAGEGSIDKVAGRDLWRVRWTENGQRQPPRYFKRKTDAADFLRAVKQRMGQGHPGIDSDAPFEVCGEQWRRTAGTMQGISTRSMLTYSGVLRLHVYPVIGHLPIKDVRASHVAAVMSKMAGKGLSKAYQHQAHKAISGVFKMAIVDELVIRNPTTSVPAPRGGHKPKVVPSREQVAAMLEQAPDPRMRAFIAVLAYTGVRISEALSLRWSDWDGAGTLRVMKPKRAGGASRPRAIPVSEKLQGELRAWRKAQAAERLASHWWDEDADWILSADVGTRWDPSNARKRFRPIANGTEATENAEAVPGVCPGATPHSLRHATATILLEEGVPMRVVADVLGHSSTRITEDVYSHVTARLSAEAAAAIDRAL